MARYVEVARNTMLEIEHVLYYFGGISGQEGDPPRT